MLAEQEKRLGEGLEAKKKKHWLESEKAPPDTTSMIMLDSG